MGIFGSKINTKLPTRTVIKRIDDCILPDEKEAVLDFMEIIEAQLSSFRFESTSREFEESGGVLILIETMRTLADDEDAMRIGVSIFDMQKHKQSIIMAFVHHGGLDLLEQIRHSYENHPYLSQAIPNLVRFILSLGASGAIDEIKRESANLGLCLACQGVLERARRMKNFSAPVDIPQLYDRINRVTMFMENFIDRVDVQIQGLEAIIIYTRNPDSKVTIRDTNVIETLLATLLKYRRYQEVVWRICLILSHVCEFSDEVANDVARIKLHEELVTIYKDYRHEPRLQQQILWVFNSCLQWNKAKKKVLHSSECVELFRRVMNNRQNQMDHFDPKNRFKAYEVVVPHRIRTFLRELNNIDFKEYVKKSGSSQNIAPTTSARRNVDPKPMFGTLKTKIFVDGEPGLIHDIDHKDDLVPLDELPDYNIHLNYGMLGKKNSSSSSHLLSMEIVPTEFNIRPRSPYLDEQMQFAIS